tara:strand:+ start:287 stop:1033 length:747 start_codon:yes stop_codon:yes gene_type:complete
MTKFKYIKLNKFKRIRYLKYIQKDTNFIVFLHGFMSDLEGEKPKAFLEFAKKNRLSFLALEYSGHGKSSGKFTSGNISKWTFETKSLINKIVKKKNIFLIGSSMGAWISINQFAFFENQIKGFLGIGSAPEFLDNLMWKKFSKKVKKEIIKKGIYYLKHGDYTYPITLQLIKDGRKNKVLRKKITSNIKVTMIHGQNDDVVPVLYSRKVLKMFKNAQKKILIVKKGDHSLSTPKWLKLITKELKLLVR